MITDFHSDIENIIEVVSEMPTAEFELKHLIADGIYVREMHVKKGTFIVGAIHKSETIAALVKGRLRLWTPEGMSIISAYCSILSPPDTQRMALVLEDTIFITMHRTDRLTVKEIEDECVVGGSSVLLGGSLNKQTIGGMPHEKLECSSKRYLIDR
jgi:hypothetical protein